MNKIDFPKIKGWVSSKSSLFQFRDATITDADNVSVSGFFDVPANTTNMPSTYRSILIHFDMDSYAVQFATRLNRTVLIVYMRKKQSNTWGDWSSITFS